LQLFQFSAKFINFALFQGIYVAVATSQGGSRFNIGFISNMDLVFGIDQPWGIGVNLLAVVAVFWLRAALRETDACATEICQRDEIEVNDRSHRGHC
jgi:hypothetical protein